MLLVMGEGTENSRQVHLIGFDESVLLAPQGAVGGVMF